MLKPNYKILLTILLLIGACFTQIPDIQYDNSGEGPSTIAFCGNRDKWVLVYSTGNNQFKIKNGGNS